MHVFLLILGAIITAAGITLVASGVSIQEHAFDLTIITPGAVAAIGGLLLIGLGLAVRVLQRIERALAARPLSPAARPDEAAATAAAAPAPELSNQPTPIPFPPKPNAEPQQQPAPAAAAAAPTPASALVDLAFGQFREKHATSGRLESTPVPAEGDLSLLASAPSPPDDEEPEEGSIGPPSSGGNGGSPIRAAPRPETSPRPVTPLERRGASVFESVWPKAAHVGRQAPPLPELEPRFKPRPLVPPAAAPQQAPVPVSILKSGVVDGMSYTLYSDGSIEAQLPRGTLRFSSITELRNLVEQGS